MSPFSFGNQKPIDFPVIFLDVRQYKIAAFVTKQTSSPKGNDR